ncbi:hypothetical protein ACFC3F_06615 [Microbacterium sp. NPDC055910]|uniref:hypothetical protein n=1 Tax=Microbacterium sp. NPDC055910 TaxID=3345659 RepID=UPI0035DF8A75
MNETTNQNRDTDAGVDAWTAEALADLLSVDVEIAERALDQGVAGGWAVRLSQGPTTFYLAGSIASRLTGFGAVPVEGERLDARRERARQDRDRKEGTERAH